MVFKAKPDSKNSVKPETNAASSSSSPGRGSGRRKSPSRTKSPSRKSSPKSKSPARTKSPSRRSPARNKHDDAPLKSSTPIITSPKARSPIRKSPTRAVKTVTKSTESYFTERVQRPRRTNLDADTDSDNEDIKPARGRTRTSKKVEDVENSTRSETLNIIKRISARNQSREIERVIHVKNLDSIAKKLGEFSDEDDSGAKRSQPLEKARDLEQITEFGGVWGTLFFTFLIPFGGLGLFLTCNESHCSFTRLPPYKKFLQLSTYFDATAVLGYVTFVALLAILSVIPFGGRKITGLPTKQGKFSYVMNGFFCTVVLGAITVGFETKNILISDFIVQHLFQLFVTSYLVGLLLSVYVYIRSFYVPLSSLNANSLGKNGIYAFFLGRELNPRVYGLLDLKIYIFRLALIGCTVLNFIYLYKGLDWNKTENGETSFTINSTLVVSVLIQNIYNLDPLISETVLVSSFEVQYEALGYMDCAGYLIYPFMLTSITKYVLDYNVQLPIWQLILITIVFIVGFIIYRESNKQKDAFRKNPYDPALSHLETIPTTKGKKLICSGLWGFVRHPNYLGDILMNLSFAPFALCVPPVLNVCAIVLLLIHRSVRDNTRCKQKYGAAWDRYCSKVKYVLVPNIY